MSLITIPVKFTVLPADGVPVAGLRVRAELTRADVDGGVLVQAPRARGDTDALGVCTINLWPNSRGVNASQYRVKVYQAVELIHNFLITVPEVGAGSWPVLAETIINQAPYPTVDAAQIAITTAQAAVVDAQGYAADANASAIAAAASQTAAATSAGTASTQAGIATAKAVLTAADAVATAADRVQTGLDRTAAAGSASAASTSAGTATTQAATATTQAGIATAQAVLTAADRVQTGLDRTAAAGSASAASGSASTATTQAGISTTKAGESAASAAAALASQNDIHNNWQAKLDSAATQAATATAQAGLAATARTAAEAARDAAQLSAGVYASTAAGLAATTTGHYFSVPASGSDVYLTLYLNSAGVAVYVNTYPALSAVDMFAKQESVVDDDVQRVVIDAKGFAGAKLTSRGWLPRIPVDRPEPAITNEMHHILGYGQSLAGGWNAKPIITASPVDDCFMFNGGVNTAEVSETPAVSMASLTAYFEQLQGASYGESPFGGFAAEMTGLYRDEHAKALSDASFRLLISNAGKDGAGISGLSKPSTYYTRILNQVTAGKALAIAAGYSYRIGAFFWTQGEYDSATAVATYLSALQTLRSNLQTDVRAITGGAETVRCIHYQTWYNSTLSAPGTQPGATLAQLAAHEAEPDKFILAAPIYFMPTVDGTHMEPWTSAWLGAYYALAYKRVVLEGRRWNPVRPLSLSVSGAVITVRLSIQGSKLVFDTRQVMLAPNYGFAAYTAAGAALTITGVQIVGADKVQVTLSAPPSAGDRLRYCDTASQIADVGYIGPLRTINGARGNLRDNAGDALKFRHPSGYVLPMHNWCVAFDKVIV